MVKEEERGRAHTYEERGKGIEPAGPSRAARPIPSLNDVDFSGMEFGPSNGTNSDMYPLEGICSHAHIFLN